MRQYSFHFTVSLAEKKTNSCLQAELSLRESMWDGKEIWQLPGEVLTKEQGKLNGHNSSLPPV